MERALLRGPQSWLADRQIAILENPERWLQANEPLSDESAKRARAGISAMVKARIGGDCWAADPGAEALNLPNRYALVVLPDSLTPKDAVEQMLGAVRREQEPSRIVAIACDGAATRVAEAIANHEQWRFVAQRLSPWTLLDEAEVVYAHDDEIGLLALFAGIKVKCFAPSLYSGWGATEDRPSVPRRTVTRGVVELFAAICLNATRYLDPFSGAPSDFESVCDMLAAWRQLDRANRKIAACLGISFWKRRSIRNFLRASDPAPIFCGDAKKAVAAARSRGGAVAVWASREPAALAALALEASVPITHIEDGFLRSVGLGADFIPGASIVVDDRGLYLDPTQPSALEILLSETKFDAALLARADRLVGELIHRRISKYNTGDADPVFEIPPSRRSIFVPGQVEDDRSVVLAGAGVAGNLDLLKRVRAANPDAFIVYKPHPDVDAGHRIGAVPDADIARYADRMVRGISSLALIAAVDEVHTLTSLAGFEALLRGRRVVVYGQPFFAGWGLTVDLAPLPRRQRRLTLSELVAGTLILYPRYLDPVTQLPCGPELVVERLAHPDLWRPGLLVRLRRLQGVLARPLRARLADR